MSVEVKRKKTESFESLLRRFTRRIQQSGKQLEYRKRRFHVHAANGTKRRVSALRRLKIGERREYLLKTGELVEERTPQRSRR